MSFGPDFLQLLVWSAVGLALVGIGGLLLRWRLDRKQNSLW